MIGKTNATNTTSGSTIDLFASYMNSTLYSLYGSYSQVPSYAFMYNTTLQDVHLPNCTYVGSSAFYGASNISSLNLENCYFASGSAFATYGSVPMNLPKLRRVTNTMISTSGVVNLENIRVLENYNKFVASSSILNWSKLEIAHTFASISGITGGNFINLYQLGVSYNADDFFSKISCPNLFLLSLYAYSGSVQNITSPARYGYLNFQNASSVKTLSFPNMQFISTIHGYSAKNLEKIYAPELMGIMYSASFSGCSLLSEFTVNEDFYIHSGSYIFMSCSSLERLDADYWHFRYGSAFSSLFYNCYKLSTVGKMLCPGGQWIFRNCSSLESIRTSYVGYSYMFAGCSKLTELYIVNASQVATYTSTALLSTPFLGETTQTGGQYGTIYVPSSWYSSYLVAAGWSSLSSLIASFPESFANEVVCYGEYRSLNSDVITSYPSSKYNVTNIYDAAFYNTYLSQETLELPNCKFIGSLAFASPNQTSRNFISYFSLPECTVISGSVFRYAMYLKSVYVPKIKFVWDGAFYWCLSLTSFVGSPYYIGTQAFYGCSSLQSFDFTNTKYIMNYAFTGCNNLSTPVSITSLISFSGSSIFQSCHKIPYINIKTLTIYSNGYAFANLSECSWLAIRAMGGGTNSYFINNNPKMEKIYWHLDGAAIPSYTIWNCTKCSELYLLNYNPTQIQNSAFGGVKFSTSSGTIYVRKGTLPAWLNTSYAKNLKCTWVEMNEEDADAIERDLGWIY